MYKSDNLPYNTLVHWFAGTNDSSTKRLMFQVFFFCFISVKTPAHLYEVSFFSALWMVFPESWKRRAADFYAHHCNSIETEFYLHMFLCWVSDQWIFFEQKNILVHCVHLICSRRKVCIKLSKCTPSILHTIACTVLLVVMKKLWINWNWNAMFSFKSTFFHNLCN